MAEHEKKRAQTGNPQRGRNAQIAVLVTLAIAALAWAGAHYAGVPISPRVLMVTRWLVAAALAAYAWARRSLTLWILVGMVAGAEVGHDWPSFALQLRILGSIFLRLIRVILAPLLFSTLVGGIAGHTNLKQVGRLAIKSIVYFEVVTTLALFIGLAAINLSRAGEGIARAAVKTEQLSAQKHTAAQIVLDIFPENIAKSVAENQVLQIVIFSILFAIALAMVREEKRRPMLQFCDSLAEVMFKFTNIIMLFAPLGVAGAIAYSVAGTGLGVLGNLARLLGTLYAALVVFLGGVLLPVALLARIPLRRFLRAVAEPASIAFGTSSSEAALPRAMEAMEGIGVPRSIVAFVMPTGYSFNLDGSTLYQSLGVVFVAQAAGVHMSLGQQLIVVLTLMLASKGTAGVSRASIVILFATVQQFNLPVEPVYLLFGVDVFMDMARTAVNVVGNCLACCVVARWEGEFPVPARSEAVADAAEG